MRSERIQRRIESLLDRAEQAADAEDWALLDERSRMVLRLDAENEDAITFLAVAEEAQGTSHATPAPTARGQNLCSCS
ncbi:MAG: hypothetical protein QF664_13760 [Dehalococcoidia bacterium]|jgi:hypothetical protein|nr:hypothetical protein [Dehalococcoidia bacterium]